MLLSELGEFGLISRIKNLVKSDASVIKGIGDDCAVLKFDRSRYQLLTCDMIAEGVDFTPSDKPFLIGRKAIAQSISDIAACGGLPHYCLVALGLPKATSVERVEQICKGIIALAKRFGINLVGGDISRARQITVNVTILGSVEKKYLTLRGGAKKGDIIFVTGRLGGSILGKHLKFMPRLKEARLLVKNFKVNSMIDISDGLILDLSHILEESRVGAMIYENLIPLSKEAAGLKDALYMGEDFELLFTLSNQEAKKILTKGLSVRFRPIGEIIDKKYGLRLIDKGNQERVIKPKGFHHF